MTSDYKRLVANEEVKQIGIDFDGVIHRNSLGYHDGTIYDPPMDGTREALEDLSSRFDIVVYTCKAKPDRELVNGKTGTQLIWEWLKENGLDIYVKEVTSEKPRAAFYIDDKAYRFRDWTSMMNTIATGGWRDRSHTS